MSTPDANEFLMGGGIPSAKFDTIGTVVTGTLCAEPEVQQQRDFDTNELKYWPDGKAMLQVRVVLQTAQRDAEIEDDDGKRAIYIKGQMQKAVQQAVKSSGATGVKVGGTLTVTFVAEEPNSRGRGNPKKVYTAAYQPPDPLAQVAGQPAIPPAQPAAPPAQPTLPMPPGIDPAVWSTLDGTQKAALSAAMSKSAAAGQNPPF